MTEYVIMKDGGTDGRQVFERIGTFTEKPAPAVTLGGYCLGLTNEKGVQHIGVTEADAAKIEAAQAAQAAEDAARVAAEADAALKEDVS